MAEHRIVSRDERLAARKALLVREKEATRLRDAVNAERLALPWVAIERDCAFATPRGRRAPKGRNERATMDFVRGHDEYGEARKSACHGSVN